MNYQFHYNTLIERAKNRLIEGYVEKHHIIPRCMDGSNWVGNMVSLTPEEHYVAHQLLIKIYPNKPKLIYAAHMMTVSSSKHFRNNKSYGWLRRKRSKIHSLLMTGKNHPFYGKTHTDETKRKMSESAKKRELPSEETKRKQSENHKGMIGKTHSEETKRKMSDSHKGRVPWNKGIKMGSHSKETKRKIGLGNKGKIVSSESRKRMSDSMKGRIPWNKGKKGVQVAWNKGISHSEETKRKISESRISSNKKKKHI